MQILCHDAEQWILGSLFAPLRTWVLNERGYEEARLDNWGFMLHISLVTGILGEGVA